MESLLEKLNFHLTPKSGNEKCGPIGVSTSSRATCSMTCPFHPDNGGGCYADAGYHLRNHWNLVTSGARGLPFNDFLDQIRKLKPDTYFRHNQAGDCVLDDMGNISLKFLNGILDAIKHLKASWTYTHHKIESQINIDRIKKANKEGFTINVSTESLTELDKTLNRDLVGVVVIPSINNPDIEAYEVLEEGKSKPTTYYKQVNKITTPEGNRVVVCPAQTRPNVTCKTCGLCSRADRKFSLAFITHGTGVKKAIQAITGG